MQFSAKLYKMAPTLHSEYSPNVRLSNKLDCCLSKHDLDDLHKEKHLDYRREDIICDTFFALVGAIYVDQVKLIFCDIQKKNIFLLSNYDIETV